MVDNQHRKISGYRELSEHDIAKMNQLKTFEAELLGIVEGLADEQNARHVALARTHIETAFMFAVKAIAKPEPYYVRE